jgi:hypothetical protein
MCPNCRIAYDRDENAAKGGLRFKPGPLGEAVKGNETTTAPILRVDSGKVTQGDTRELSEPAPEFSMESK